MGGYIGQKPTAVPLTSADIEDGVVSSADLGANSVDSSELVDGSIDTSHIGDDQITLAKMASGTDGNIISYDASGNPVAIATGSDGEVLTSTGAGSPPAFEALPSGTTLSGTTNNTVATVTGANALIGESNLTFDGTNLNVTGSTTITNDLNVNDDINLNSDSAVLTFGADSEVTLTHVHNTGLILGNSSASQLTSVLTIGVGDTADTLIKFDGNVHDFRVGLDDSHDLFEIGHGTSPARYGGITLDGNKHVYIQGVVTDSGANLLAGCASMWIRPENASTLNVSMADDATITPNLVGGQSALIFVGTNGGGYRGSLFMASYGSSTIVKLGDPTGEFDVAVTDGRIMCLTKAINTPVVTVTNKAGSTQAVNIATISNLGL